MAPIVPYLDCDDDGRHRIARAPHRHGQAARPPRSRTSSRGSRRRARTRACRSGREATVIGAIGERELLVVAAARGLPRRGAGAADPQAVQARRRASSSPDPTVIEVRGRGSAAATSGSSPARARSRPASRRSRPRARVAAAGATMLRGGAFKPRTLAVRVPGARREGLEILAEAREETGLPIVTELMDPRHVERSRRRRRDPDRRPQHAELLAARRGRRVDKPVLLKRGLSATIEELLMAAEYIVKEGNEQVILCERGIRTFETVDALHARHRRGAGAEARDAPAGDRRPVACGGPARPRAPLARAAVAAGADGIIVEVHPRPDEALCDAAAADPDVRVRRLRGRDPRARGPDGQRDRLASVARRAGGRARRAHRRARRQVDLAPRGADRRGLRRARRGSTGFGRSGDTEATVDGRARARRRGRRGRRSTRLVVARRRPARPARAGRRRSTAGTPARSCGCSPGIARRPGRARSSSPATSRCRARPMERIAEPLRPMGADVETTDGRAPLVDRAAAAARRSTYELPVASAQVKSAVLLAGPLRGRRRTTVVEPTPTRDHTERMLAARGRARRARGRVGRPSRRAAAARRSTRSRCPATSRRPRRSSSRRRCCPARS